MRRYLGLVAFYLFLAATLTFGHRAHAAELPPGAPPEPNPACVEFVQNRVPMIHALFVANVDPAIIKYLIVSSDEFTDIGRWVLVYTVYAMEHAAEGGRRMTQSEALTFGTEVMCRLPETGAVPAAERGEFVPTPQEI